MTATSAADVNATQIQSSNTNTLNEDIETQTKSQNISKNSTTTQTTVDKSVKETKKVKKTKIKKQVPTQNKDKTKAKQYTENTASSANVQNSITSSSVAKTDTITNVKVSDNTQTTTVHNTTVNDAKSVENSSVTNQTKDTTQTQTTSSTTTTPTAQTAVEKPFTNVNTTNTSVTAPITNNTPVSTETTNTSVITQNTTTSQNVSSESPASSSTQPTANAVNNDELLPAAGETKTPVTFTVTQVKDASSRVKAFVETNKRLPKYVTIGTTQVKMPDFLQLLTSALLQIKNGTNNPITLKTLNTATKPTETFKSGTLTKTSYLDLAKRVNAYIATYGKIPNYATTSLGKMKYESLIYTFSKVLNFQKTNNRLPSYVSVKPWSTVGTSSATGTTSGTVSTPVPADLVKYLAATSNAQVNDPRIKALAASITAGKTTSYAKGVAIFNWVRDNLAYSFYYNTKYGAVGALNVRKGNCVDTTHLIVALSRAAGLPTRYAHGNVRFPSGNTYGHVWAEVWVNGKWYKADGTSSRNTFGYMSGTVVYFKGYHLSLPF